MTWCATAVIAVVAALGCGLPGREPRTKRLRRLLAIGSAPRRQSSVDDQAGIGLRQFGQHPDGRELWSTYWRGWPRCNRRSPKAGRVERDGRCAPTSSCGRTSHSTTARPSTREVDREHPSASSAARSWGRRSMTSKRSRRRRPISVEITFRSDHRRSCSRRSKSDSQARHAPDRHRTVHVGSADGLDDDAARPTPATTSAGRRSTASSSTTYPTCAPHGRRCCAALDMLYEVGADALDSLEPARARSRCSPTRGAISTSLRLQPTAPGARDRKDVRSALNRAIDRDALVARRARTATASPPSGRSGRSTGRFRRPADTGVRSTTASRSAEPCRGAVERQMHFTCLIPPTRSRTARARCQTPACKPSASTWPSRKCRIEAAARAAGKRRFRRGC